MENNDIMKRLLQEDSHSESPKNVEWANKQNKGNDLPISRIRVVTAKYKVYIVLLLIFICILLLEAIPNMKDSYKATMDSYQTAKSKLTAVQDWITKAKNDMTYLWEIVSNERSLKTCLNERNKEACLSLPESWKEGDEDNKQYDLTVPLSYLQLHSLYNKKMPVDEKKVLKNLNEYLIKQDIAWNSRTKVWDILRIEIWDPKAFKNWDNHFFEVPVEVTIEFTTVGDLTGFLYNIEKKLIDNWEDRILYKIQSISYDIVSRDEPQTTNISMLAYYYHDERFENVDEQVDADVEQEWNSSEEWSITEESDNSQNAEVEGTAIPAETTEQKNEKLWWFFSKIFNS